jgi:3-phosphoshikimate 1-carboxyvinyltransferase
MQGTNFPAPIKHVEKIGSAQVKSAIQFAALNTPGITKIIEVKKSRDHTENLLKFIGVKIKVNKKKSSNKILIEGQKEFKFFKLNIPGDISSAAFFIVLTILNKNSKLKIKNINLNPTRAGILKILTLMKAKISLKNIKNVNGEKRGDIIVKSSKLVGINCPTSLVPSAIDEFPIIMLAASLAKGVSTFSGLNELEKKESPRLSVMNSILRQINIKTRLKKDKIKIYGNGDINLKKTYKIKTFGDHRICMTAFIMAQLFGGKFNIKDCNSINTSFPKFLTLMKKIGAHYEIK